jgi:hypothetical protein
MRVPGLADKIRTTFWSCRHPSRFSASPTFNTLFTVCLYYDIPGGGNVDSRHVLQRFLSEDFESGVPGRRGSIGNPSFSS